MTELLDNRTIQSALRKTGFYRGTVDGVAGTNTQKAYPLYLASFGIKTEGWSVTRERTAVEQLILKARGFDVGKIDGFVGPSTMDALERYQNELRDTTPAVVAIAHQPTRWPREIEVPTFYGPVGTSQVPLQFPYPMKLAWDVKSVVNRTQCHSKVHDSLQRIFATTLATFGHEKIVDLGLDLFGGCLNVRAKKGGHTYSMHSWGIAIDLDPEHNQLRWGRGKARLSGPEYDAFWKIVESEGWVSLGREKNFDWMHFQAARL